MMDISHLYHDAAFGDPTLELDVKEQLKTREVNAREERNLANLHRSYDREMDICEKNTAWERWKVGKSLQGIWERSPRLEKRLAMEKARIEALERSILYRNYRMNTNTSNFSLASRLSNVSLKPLPDYKKPQGKIQPKKKEKFSRDENETNKNNNDNNDERGTVRQADFVRRSEHSIKALAKLNWKQQNRRRDHEKFKEDLFFHSKHVIEKAQVVLKGRPGINVENIYTDFESILLPPVKKPPNLNNNFKPHFKSSKSNLYEKNVLHLNDSADKKPYPSRLAPVSENLELYKEKNTAQSKSENQILEKDSKQRNPSSSEETDPSLKSCENSSKPETVSPTSKDTPVSISSHNQSSGLKNESESTRLPVLTQINNDNTSNNEISTNQTTEPIHKHEQNKTTTSINSETVVDSTDSRTKTSPNYPCNPEYQQQHQQQPNHSHSHPFSPSTSISQVIIEEEEDENEEDPELVALTKPGDEGGDDNSDHHHIHHDINNNDITTHEKGCPNIDDNADEANTGGDDAMPYTMTCTTGLPQLWKQSKKPKEKPQVEVSAASIARKHKRKRRDRW